jgi:molybdate transport system permease protein
MKKKAFPILFSIPLALLTGAIALIIIADISYVHRSDIVSTLLSKDIISSMFLTLETSAVTTLISVLIAIPSAYALSRFKFPGAIVLDTLIDLLIVVPVLVVGVSILVFFRMGFLLESSSFGPAALAGKAIQWLADVFIYQRAGIVLAQFFCSVPFAVRVIKSTFDDMSPRTEHVAQTLGCGRLQAFFRVSLPLARQGIFAGAVLAWARAFGLFGPISIVAGAVRQRTEVLSTSIFLEISIGQLEKGIALSLMMVAIASLILVLLRIGSGKTLFGGNVQR